MFFRRSRIRQWDIAFIVSYDELDAELIKDALLWANAPKSIISRVEDGVLAGRLNEGFCYSNPALRRTVMGIGSTEHGYESLNTAVHEIVHAMQGMAIEDGMALDGEEVAYLAGSISELISDIVCEVACPHCREK